MTDTRNLEFDIAQIKEYITLRKQYYETAKLSPTFDVGYLNRLAECEDEP